MPESRRMPEVQDLSGITVLVVEQDEDDSKLYRLFLESCRAHVVTLSTAAAALHYLGFSVVDVVLAEASILGTARRTFIRAVHTLPKCADLPVLAVTAWPQDTPEAADGEGFAAVMLKPVDLDEIAATIARLVGQRRARDSSSPCPELSRGLTRRDA